MMMEMKAGPDSDGVATDVAGLGPDPMSVPEHCREWRVSWRREGAHWQQRILQTDTAKSVLVVELRTQDLHYRCDEDHRDCLGALVAGPVVKWRATTEWREA